MTINSETRVAGPFEGNDSTVAFPFSFKVFADTEVLVVSETASIESNLVLGSDYYVSLNADQNAAPGGTVVLTAPLATGTRLTVTSALEYLQPVDLTNQGGFYPRVINNAFDRLTILLQQLFERLGRALVFPISDGQVGEIPGAGQRAGSVLAFHEVTGDPVVGPSIADVNTVAGFIGNVNTVATNIVDVNTVAGGIANVNAVGQNIAAVNNVSTNMADVNNVSLNMADVNAVADGLADVTNFADVYYGPSATDPATRRDGTPLQNGDLYFNTASSTLRAYNGTAWHESVTGSVTVQNLSGNGVATQFTLNYAPESEVITSVFVSGVYQQKNTYELGGVGGDVLIFSEAPPAGTDNIEVVVSSLTPSDDVLRQELASVYGASMIGGAGQVVSSIASLRDLLKTSPSKSAFVTGYYSQGDGGGGAYYLDATDTTSTDNGGTIIVATDGGRWKLQNSDYVSVRQFGAKLDGVTDDTSAFNNTLAFADKVLFPKGDAYITNTILVPNNKQLIGAGANQSQFIIDSTFNMTAAGVVQMGSSENTGLITGVGFVFSQPDSSIRADMIQYPPAINHAGIPRVRIGHVRISRGWNGVDATGNAGGATYDWIECGCLNVGLKIDGALDTMNIGRFRFWPFGMSANVGVGVVYRDGNTIAASIGKCDGLEGEIHSFRGRVEFPASGAGSAGRHLHALHLDGDGARLVVLDGTLDISYVYITKTSDPTLPSILLDGASYSPTVRISDIDMLTEQSSVSIIVNSGSLQISGGRMDHRALDKEAVVVQSSGRISLRNCELTARGTRTTSYVRSNSTAATLIVQNCSAPNNGGTGTLINLAAGSSDCQIGSNSYGGRKLVVSPSYAVGKVSEAMGGYVSADAATTVRLPGGWTVSLVSDGNYSITHALGWDLTRTRVSVTPVNVGDATASWDLSSSTSNAVRIRTKLGGVAANTDFTIEVAHT